MKAIQLLIMSLFIFLQACSQPEKKDYMIELKVVDEYCFKPVSAFDLKINYKEESLNKRCKIDNSGKLLCKLDCDSSYKFSISKEGFVSKHFRLAIPPNCADTLLTVVLEDIEHVVYFPTIRFFNNSLNIQEVNLDSSLNTIKEILNSKYADSLKVYGYRTTDEDYNLDFERAQKIKDLLVNRYGIRSNKLKAVGGNLEGFKVRDCQYFERGTSLDSSFVSRLNKNLKSIADSLNRRVTFAR